MRQNERVVRMLGLVLTAVFPVLVWAGTTGKIAGIVTDNDTRNPIMGANVMVVGTTLGAATDQAGQYTILYVPPGTYEIQVSVIGYAKTTVSDIRVVIDQTAHVNIELEVEIIQGETITVVAQREIVKTDVATSTVAVSERDLVNLPVANVQDVIGLQAGTAVLTDRYNVGKFQIRGSFGDQALFLLDGVTMRDPRNNQALTKVALSSVKEITVERGGFNAEYGQVQAGIINIVTKEGGSRGYSGSIMTRIAPPAPKYYRGHGIPDVQDPNSYWLRPYLDDDVCWVGTANGTWDEYTRDKYPSFIGWNQVSKQLMEDNDPSNDLTPLGAQRVFLYESRKRQNNKMADYDIDAGFGGPVPLISEQLGNLRFYTSYRRQRDVLLFPMTRPDYTDYDWRLVLNSDIAKSMKLSVSGLVGNIATMEENWSKGVYPHYPIEIAGGTGGSALFNMFSDWTYSLTDISHQNLAVKLTHTLSSKTFYEVSLENFRRHYYSRPPDLRDTSKVYEIIPGFYETSNPYGYWPTATSNDGIIIYAGEQHCLARDNTTASATTIKADLSSQVNFSNLVKTGFEFVYHNLDLDYGFIQMQTGGNLYNWHVQMHTYPVRAAAYVQDKLETKGFTLNAGLRFDYSNSRTDWWNIDPYDPNFISSKYTADRQFNEKKSRSQWQLSPRLGISHPITETSKLFFNYGHYKQMPNYENMFRVDRRADQSLVRIGDPNLVLARTISYELGFDQLLLNNLLIQIAAFYRDISDQDTVTTYYSIQGVRYTKTTSNRYQDIRGFELTLRKTTGRWFSGFANYTYQVTSSGNFGREELYQDPAKQTDYDEQTVKIYQIRPIPTPGARANLSLYTPDDFGPKLFGQNILGGFLMNILLNWSQGGWTTYNPKNISGVANNVQYVDYFDATLRLSKTFSFKRVKVQLLADVMNLTNELRLRETGGQDYRTSLHLPKDKAYDNIPGHDKLGDFRKPGVEWQPMEYQAVIDTTKTAGSTRAIYYEGTTGEYWQFADDVSLPNEERWQIVDQKTIDKINKNKAYINMPSPSTFWFLDPRKIIFGIRISFDLK